MRKLVSKKALPFRLYLLSVKYRTNFSETSTVNEIGLLLSDANPNRYVRQFAVEIARQEGGKNKYK